MSARDGSTSQPSMFGRVFGLVRSRSFPCSMIDLVVIDDDDDDGHSRVGSRRE